MESAFSCDDDAPGIERQALSRASLIVLKSVSDQRRLQEDHGRGKRLLLLRFTVIPTRKVRVLYWMH